MALKSVPITLSAVSATQLVVQGVGATQFTNVAGSATDPLPCIITNTDAAITILVGGPGVTIAAGTPIKAGGSLPMSLIGSGSVSDIPFAIAASGTPVVTVLLGRQ